MRIIALFILLTIHHLSWSIDIIAHRGASGYLPEHTKEATIMAYMQGADYIEQDLVLSKDDHLVVLHDIHIETVTNVEQIFPQRARKDGRYYAIDFTLDELRQLRVHERENGEKKRVFESRYTGSANFTIATFSEMVELISELNRMFGTNTGFYPEIKAPEWHLSENKNIADVLVKTLNSLQLNNAQSRIFVQSFEPTSLQYLKDTLNIKVPLVQLIASNNWGESSADYTQMQTQEGLNEIAKYATAIGPWLPQIVSEKGFSDLVRMAKKAGLKVYPYTYRIDVINNDTKAKELFLALKKHGIDGLFTDHIMSFMK